MPRLTSRETRNGQSDDIRRSRYRKSTRLSFIALAPREFISTPLTLCQCGTFRAFQGWTSLSHTGPTEGTLRVYPYLRELSAYVLLRPLFRPKSPLPSNESGEEGSAVARNAYLSSENWELDMETSRFPGAPLARGQELNDETHPHLELGRTMVSVPAVKPGDQVFWHCGECRLPAVFGTSSTFVRTTTIVGNLSLMT